MTTHETHTHKQGWLDAQLNWTAAASSLSAREGIRSLLLGEAGRLFGLGKDQEAKLIRTLADNIVPLIASDREALNRSKAHAESLD